MSLTSCQESAANTFMQFLVDPTQTEMILKGSPGRGKTFLLKHLLAQLPKDMQMIKILGGDALEEHHLTAFTNKAADVATSSTGFSTGTIHSLIGLRVFDDFKTGKRRLIRAKDSQPIENALIIIDEAFMLDVKIEKFLKESIRNCKILYVGDPDQLGPVVEAGVDPVCPLINADYLTAVLETPVRYGGAIATLCDQTRDFVRTGVFSDLIVDGKDVRYIDDTEIQQIIADNFKLHDDPNKMKICCYTNRKTKLFNNYVRESHGLPVEFVEGDVVVNNGLVKVGKKSIPNESVHIIKAISKGHEIMDIPANLVTLGNNHSVPVAVNQADVAQAIKAAQSSGNYARKIALQNTFADLRATSACTVHKAQGSTYETVIVDLEDIGSCHDADTFARLINTACSRASKQILLYGELPARYRG